MTLKSIWIDYCENGSIHGLRHIIQKDEKPLMRYLIIHTDVIDILYNLYFLWFKMILNCTQIYMGTVVDCSQHCYSGFGLSVLGEVFLLLNGNHC